MLLAPGTWWDPAGITVELPAETKGWKSSEKIPSFGCAWFCFSARTTFPALSDLHLHSSCHGGAGPECCRSGPEPPGRVYPQTTGTHSPNTAASPLTAGSRVYRPGEGFPRCVESRLIASHKSAIAVCPYIRWPASDRPGQPRSAILLYKYLNRQSNEG